MLLALPQFSGLALGGEPINQGPGSGVAQMAVEVSGHCAERFLGSGGTSDAARDGIAGAEGKAGEGSGRKHGGQWDPAPAPQTGHDLLEAPECAFAPTRIREQVESDGKHAEHPARAVGAAFAAAA